MLISPGDRHALLSHAENVCAATIAELMHMSERALGRAADSDARRVVRLDVRPIVIERGGGGERAAAATLAYSLRDSLQRGAARCAMSDKQCGVKTRARTVSPSSSAAAAPPPRRRCAAALDECTPEEATATMTIELKHRAKRSPMSTDEAAAAAFVNERATAAVVLAYGLHSTPQTNIMPKEVSAAITTERKRQANCALVQAEATVMVVDLINRKKMMLKEVSATITTEFKRQAARALGHYVEAAVIDEVQAATEDARDV
ncbi:hypothetical protein JKP88DRAFT_283451 [Tribonema minus]|uniref:Uncharacterized protein n=1 Tax=Tribonema minus TaxID=303371 RepID=A0A836C804_9STRA|nr:hypothetical protein JKP88DRAFT_283451 [Tribonema minus]